MNENIISTVDEIIKKTGKTVDYVIPILQAVQAEFNYLPEEAMQRVCEITEISLARIYSISTFYSQFRHKPVGKHIVKVCIGTACHVKGAVRIYDAFKRVLEIPDFEDTDADKIFTIEKVACLGCCTIAPVVQIDDTTYGCVETDKVQEIIDDFLNNQNNPKAQKSEFIKKSKIPQGEIRIGLGSCCIASGSSDVKLELENNLANNNLHVDVKQVGCVGICNQVPMMEIHKPNEKPYFYTKIKADDVNKIIRRHFKTKNIYGQLKNRFSGYFNDLVFKDTPNTINRYSLEEKDTPISEFLDGQVNIATLHRGVLKPDDLDEYKRLGGFGALKKCLEKYSPDEIIEIIKKSGLRGRGGGGFLSGVKWELAKNAQSDKKYVICNGDEGDPGAFMDRMLLESYPFRIIEGLMIAAIAIGACEGYFYIRAEYPLAVKRIKEAIRLCEEQNILGENIQGSDCSFILKVFEGAGAFICGEETALITSIEGNRGMPKMRPPYPSESGLWGKPTLINNTETFSLVPWIIDRGHEAFAKIGTDTSKGTKVFALAGKINRGGLIEVPMGITIKEIVEKIGGGIPNGKKFKAVQIGGPSGGCIPASMSDISIDFESLHGVGAMMGSGGLVVLDQEDCMVDIAKYFLAFTQDQSCGKCTFCRIGTKQMLRILDKICSGNGNEKDLVTLEKLAYSIKKGSLCALGKTAPNPVLSTLKYFRNEYEEHIKGNCKCGKCEALTTYFITDDCIGCTKCAQICPVAAIDFNPYEQHVVDTEKCINCDACRQVCPENAIITK